MEGIISIFVIQFWALFLTIDAIGVTPIFISLTSGIDAARRKQIANKGVLIAFLILVFFALTGSILLDLFGISLPAFRLAGGILLLLLSIEMVLSKTKSGTNEESDSDIAVFPISIPLLSGPAAITMLILFIKQSNGLIWKKLIVLLALLLNMVIVWVCLRFASKISKLMGNTGANVVTKIFGILLTALACQFIIDGIFEAIKLN
ncbi:MAG: MarC family protein [Candidatus Gastranaerophilales bacterium]|nr:MarC family protein [Candidatus Gastranaerophilales bacterium]